MRERYTRQNIEPTRPVTHGNINYDPVDFHGAKLAAFYDRDKVAGEYRLTTMYPEPDEARNK